mmetsp:Transcript_7772/g.21570  ORF Transcript_7772/g.21570 Transcript_7772/m.21570 type:complete len:320 (-) Transcript_7772:144-1103(-)
MMWNLGKVLDTPEASRVFVGSFWDDPLANTEQRRLFESEQNELYAALEALPRNAALRKLADLGKRARTVRAHAHLLEHLRKKVGSVCWRKDKEKLRLLSDLPSIYGELSAKRDLPQSDFPDPAEMRRALESADFSKFARVDHRVLGLLESLLNVDLPRLVALMHSEVRKGREPSVNTRHALTSTASPFGLAKVNGALCDAKWLLPPDPRECEEEFLASGAKMGLLSAQKAKAKLVESKLPSIALHKIWSLADIDKDGALTLYEYALAKHFIRMRLDGQDLPSTVPPQMLPPEADCHSRQAPTDALASAPLARGPERMSI